MLVVDDDRLDCLQRNINDILDTVEAFICYLLASRLLEVEAQVVDGPFRTVLLVVLFSLLLDCNVRQMNHHVIDLR